MVIFALFISAGFVLQVRRYVKMDRAVNQDGRVVRLYQPPESSVVQFKYNVTCVNSGQSCSVVKDRSASLLWFVTRTLLNQMAVGLHLYKPS